MDILKKVFPHAFKANELIPFIVILLIYLLIDVVCGAVIYLLSWIPFVGTLFYLLGSAVALYAFVGIVLSILVFMQVIK